MARSKVGSNAVQFVPRPPKRTRQGDGLRSKPYSGKRHRKLSRGQGRG